MVVNFITYNTITKQRYDVFCIELKFKIMKILCKNTPQGLVPLYNSDLEEKKKLKLGEDYEVSIKHPRSIKYHRRFFALLKLGFDNSNITDNFTIFRKVVLIRCGYSITAEVEGEVIEYAQSISFDKISQGDFQTLYNTVHKYFCEVLKLPKNIENELIDLM